MPSIWGCGFIWQGCLGHDKASLFFSFHLIHISIFPNISFCVYNDTLFNNLWWPNLLWIPLSHILHFIDDVCAGLLHICRDVWRHLRGNELDSGESARLLVKISSPWSNQCWILWICYVNLICSFYLYSFVGGYFTFCLWQYVPHCKEGRSCRYLWFLQSSVHYCTDFRTLPYTYHNTDT